TAPTSSFSELSATSRGGAFGMFTIQKGAVGGPLERRGLAAMNSCGPPTAPFWIVNIPNAPPLDVALSSENELVGAVGLIHVELKGLRIRGSFQVKVHVINKMSFAESSLLCAGP